MSPYRRTSFFKRVFYLTKKYYAMHSTLNNPLVGLAGIEPVRVSPLDPKSNASTSSAISPAEEL